MAGVLVLRALGLGDFLTAVPALRGLRSGYPRDRLVLAGPAALEPLARHSGTVDELEPAKAWAPLARVEAELPEQAAEGSSA